MRLFQGNLQEKFGSFLQIPPSKWKDFQPSASESYASWSWLMPFTYLLHWQDPRIALSSLIGRFHWSALTYHSQAHALGMNLPISWCRSLSGTQRDRKKCGRTPLPYNDIPSIWGEVMHPQEQAIASCFAITPFHPLTLNSHPMR